MYEECGKRQATEGSGLKKRTKGGGAVSERCNQREL